MSSEMVSFEVLKKPKFKKVSNSNILKKIIYSLENKLHTHMLYWDDRKKKEFIIKFVHKNNPTWNSTYLELFKELDKSSYKYKKYLQEDNYEERCKGRCKSNLKKLCGKNNNGALTFIQEIKEGKSTRLMKYKLNENGTSNVKNPVSKIRKVTKKSNVQNELSGCKTLKCDKAYWEGRLKVGSLPNETSHYLCLSNSKPIVYVTIPVEAKPKSCGNLAESTLLGISCSIKESLGDDKDVIHHSTIYEHEKQIDKNNGSLATVCAESAIPNSDNLVEVMSPQNVAVASYTPLKSNGYESGSNLPNKTQDGPPSAICDGSTIPDFNNHVEMMNAQNVSIMQHTIPGYNGYESCCILPKNLQTEGLQDSKVEGAQVVPSSPLKYLSNDTTSDWDTDDISKPLQGDHDPLLSSTISVSSSNNLLKENGCLLSDIELQDWFSFENITSIDDG